MNNASDYGYSIEGQLPGGSHPPQVGDIWDTRCKARVAVIAAFTNGPIELINIVVLTKGDSGITPGNIYAAHANGLLNDGYEHPLDLVAYITSFRD